MRADWNDLSDRNQIELSWRALQRAAVTFADQAECLAGEIERGGLQDNGGAEALRLFAAVLLTTSKSSAPSSMELVAS